MIYTISNHYLTKGDIVKISRNAERFWLLVTHVTRRKIYTIVDSYVFNQPFHRGDVLVIDESEIIEALHILCTED